MSQDPFMRTGEVARLFGVTAKTVGNWVRQGRLVVAHRTPGGQVRFLRSTVMETLVRSMSEGAGPGHIV